MHQRKRCMECTLRYFITVHAGHGTKPPRIAEAVEALGRHLHIALVGSVPENQRMGCRATAAFDGKASRLLGFVAA